MNDEKFVVRLDPETVNELETAASNGDFAAVREKQELLRGERTKIYNAMLKADARVVDTLRELVADSRAYDADLSVILKNAQDAAHARQIESLAETANTIAERSEETARALKNATIALVAVTAILAIATVVLVIATFQLD